uniref:FIP-RBD domain-containing protein n=1 Tax=Caenorhabditis tropicalis TaxID=1561998 RepID=A0A1I7TWE6_9PELO
MFSKNIFKDACVFCSDSPDYETNEISNLTDQYAQSLQQQVQLLQIENSFLKKQNQKKEDEEQERIRRMEIQREIEERYRTEQFLQDQHYAQEIQEQQSRRNSSSRKERSPTTKILARGNEVSLNGETWCQLPPYHPPIPAIISDRSQYSQRVGRGERSFYDSYSRDRREYSVPCFPRTRHTRERSFVRSQTLEREESLMNTLEEAIERNAQLEKEMSIFKERELDNERVINTLSSRIKIIEMEKKDEIEILTNEKKGLLEELLDMQKRIDELAPACAEKELKIVATDNEKHDLTKKLRHANSDISQLQATIMHLHDDITSKENEIKSLNNEVVYVKSRILVLEGDMDEMRVKETESQERINTHLQQSREFELTKLNDKKLIDKIMEENSNLIKENAKISTKLTHLESIDFSVKQRELKEAQTNNELVTELKASLQLEKNSSHSLQNKIEILRQRCEELEQSVLDRDKSWDETIVERGRVEKELNALHALSKSLSSENKVLREEKLTNEEIIDELKGKVRALEMSIRSAQNIFQEKERQNSAKIEELEIEALKKHQKYLEFEEISKTLHQITALLPSKTSSMTQPSQSDCSK